jgi:hypothetical protein
MAAKPISSVRRTTGTATGCLVAFFALFALAGAVAFWFAVLRPLVSVVAARSWRETPCIVLTSRVGESSDSDSTTYKVEVLYAYTVDGRSYQSDRYSFETGSSSTRGWKEKAVASLSPGTRTTCWVDPADPRQAVISRGFSRDLFFLVPLTSVFLLVGVGGMVWVLKASRSAAALRAGVPVETPFGVAPPAGAVTGALELRPTATPLGKLVGVTILTLFWNGIISVFVWKMVESWRNGSPDGCLTTFLIPFVVIGLLLLFSTFHQLLVLFNPRVHLTLTPGALTPGGIAYLEWRLSGRGGGVRRLRILLEGREEARYRRGTSTYTDRNTFATVTVVDTSQPFEIPAGNARVDVPAETVPSFTATHNKIVWSLKVACEIPGWPDSDDEYEVLVQP